MRIASEKDAPGTMKRVSDIHKGIETGKSRKIAPNTMLSDVRHNGDVFKKGDVIEDAELQKFFRAQGLIS